MVEVAAVVDQLTARLPVDGTSHLAGAVAMTTAAETTSLSLFERRPTQQPCRLTDTL